MGAFKFTCFMKGFAAKGCPDARRILIRAFIGMELVLELGLVLGSFAAGFAAKCFIGQFIRTQG